MSARGGRASGGSGAGAGVFLAVIGGLVVLGCLLVWVAGALGSLLAGHAPVVLSASEASGVLARLPHHLGDPARAWPAAVRGELPGRATMLAAAIVTLGVLVVLAGCVLWLIGRARGGRDRHRAARWAGGRDLRRLAVRGPRRGRVILGRYQRQLLASEPRTSVLVIGPAQSRKTTGLAVLAILEWDGPVLVTSVKADAAQDTYAAC